MIDLQGRLVLQSNINSLTEDIQSKLKGIKGNLNLFNKNALDNAAGMHKRIEKLRMEMEKLAPEAAKVSTSFKQMSSAFKTMEKAANADAVAVKRARTEHRAASSEVRKHLTVMEQFGDQAGIAAKRYTAFSIAVGIGFGALRASHDAIKSSIQFQDKMVKMSQITGKSLNQLKPLSKEITNLSTGLGVSSEKLSDVSLTLLQAGLTSRDTKKALEALAKVELAPSFGNIEQATEAAIAIMAQFGTTTDDLSAQLSSINKVSADFAVEAQDIVVAIQRAGAAFGQLSKDTDNPKDALNEFIALFTSVRSTTRESAETIATGLRTIFTRLQRPQTLQFFDSLGVKLTDSKNRFIGLYPAIQKISAAIKDIPFTDPRMAAIGEELGGFRQINKTIPLLTQMSVTQKALNTAKAAGTSLDETAAKAQESLAVQINKVHESLLALFRDIQDTKSFQGIANSMLLMANSAIGLAHALKPLIPLITVLVGFKGLKIFSEFTPALIGRVMGKVPVGPFQGHPHIFGKADGGIIPGHGSGDTQPIMATPGEFMIKKSSAQKIGYGALHRLNKYAKGGIIGMAGGGIVPPANGEGYSLQGVIKPLQEILAVEKQTLAINKGVMSTPYRNRGYRVAGKNGKAEPEGYNLNPNWQPGYNVQGMFKEHLHTPYAVASNPNYQAHITALRTPFQRNYLSPMTSLERFHGFLNAPNVVPNQDLLTQMTLGGTFGATGSSQGGLSQATRQSQVYRNARKGLYGSNNFGSSVLRALTPFGSAAGGAIQKGLMKSWNRFGAAAAGNGPVGLSVGAIAANQLLGSAATNSNDGWRNRKVGMAGDVLSGGLGGAAAGAALTGGPWGAAIGAVVGLTTAFIEAKQTVKTLDFHDALEKAAENARKGKFINFSPLTKGIEEEGEVGIKDYFEAFLEGRTDNISGWAGKGAKERQMTFLRQNEGEFKGILSEEAKGLGRGHNTYEEARQNPQIISFDAHVDKLLAHLSSPEREEFKKTALGFGQSGFNINTTIDRIDAAVAHLGELADAMEGANEATKSLTDSLDLTIEMAHGRAGVANITNRSGLIKNPSIATFGETAKELQGLGQFGIDTGTTGFAAYTQANMRRLALTAYNAQGLENKGVNPANALADELDKLEKEFSKFGLGNAGSAKAEVRNALEFALGQTGKTANFEEFQKKLANPLGHLLSPAAEIRSHSTERMREFINSRAKLNEAQIGVGRTRFGAAATGVEAYNKALEFKGITQGSRSTFSDFASMQRGLAGDMGMHPGMIAGRIAQLQAIRARPEDELTDYEIADLNDEMMNLTTALDNLSRATDQNTSIEKQLAEINANRGERVGLGEEFLGANPAGRGQILRSLHLTNAFKNGGLDLGNLGPEDFGLLSDRIKKSGNIFPGIGNQFEESVLNSAGIQLPNNDRQLLQQRILGNFGIQQQAQNIQAGLQEDQVGTGLGLAAGRLEAALGPLFNNFQDRFEKAVGMMPQSIELKGEHNLNVNINGAEAFATMKQEFADLVRNEVRARIQILTAQLREKPPNGPGLPLRGIN